LHFIIYFLIALFATTSGAIAGIGGGIIIRPLLDILGDFDVRTISVLSSITVLTMAFVSAGKQVAQKAKLKYEIVLPLAIGAAGGGVIGQIVFSQVVTALQRGALVTALQNALLLFLVATVFVYMKKRESIKSHNLRGLIPSMLVGLCLGIVSSFLGIGGGPINVALMIFLFSFDIKIATVCSIITILFSQLANVLMVALHTGFGAFDLSMLLPMMIGAVAGGFIGAVLNKKMSARAVENCFNSMQLIVVLIATINIVTNLISQ